MTKRKLFLSIGIPVGVAGAFTVGVMVPIFLKEHHKEYTVRISSATDSRYVLTQFDISQNKPKEASVFIWDLRNDINNGLEAAMNAMSLSDKSLVVATIKGQKIYEDGLEKLIYDLMHAKNNGEELSLSFPKMSDAGPLKITFKTSDFLSKNVAGRKIFLSKVLLDQVPTEWNKDGSVAKSVESPIKGIKIIKHILGGDTFAAAKSTELIDIEAAFTALENKKAFDDIK